MDIITYLLFLLRNRGKFRKIIYQNATIPEVYQDRYFKNGSHCADDAESIYEFFMLFVSTMSFSGGWDDQVHINYLEMSNELNKRGLSFICRYC